MTVSVTTTMTMTMTTMGLMLMLMPMTLMMVMMKSTFFLMMIISFANPTPFLHAKIPMKGPNREALS